MNGLENTHSANLYKVLGISTPNMINISPSHFGHILWAISSETIVISIIRDLLQDRTEEIFALVHVLILSLDTNGSSYFLSLMASFVAWKGYSVSLVFHNELGTEIELSLINITMKHWRQTWLPTLWPSHSSLLIVHSSLLSPLIVGLPMWASFTMYLDQVLLSHFCKFEYHPRYLGISISEDNFEWTCESMKNAWARTNISDNSEMHCIKILVQTASDNILLELHPKSSPEIDTCVP